MKNSGIEWMGEIPNSWDVVRLKNVLKERNETNKPVKTTEILSLTNDRGVIPYAEKGDVGNKSKEDLTGYKLAYPNDIVLNSMNVIIGSVALSKYYGCVSPVYYMLNLRHSNHSIEYYNFLFQTKELQSKLKGYGNGIMEIRLRIPIDKLNSVELPIPPADIQHKIVKKLNITLDKVDKLIENEQKQIEKMKEYKQSVITSAVTKGLDKSAPLKDSGIEWIGEIPESWSVQKINYAVNQIRDIDHYMPESVADGIPYIMTGDLKSKTSEIDFSKVKQVSEEDYLRLSSKIVAKKGDIIFARYATIGTLCYVDIEERFLVSYSCVIIKVNREKIYSPYFCYYLKSITFLEEIQQYINTNIQGNIGIESLKQAKTTIPLMEEQKEIADYLDEKCGKIDEVISIKQRKIEKLQEYKKSLIYEYVTGKKEVV